MSTENPYISNFEGLEPLQSLFADATLIIDDEGRKVTLGSEEDRFDCERDALSRLGLALEVPGAADEFSSAATDAGLTLEDVDLVVIAEGPFLKQRAVIAHSPLAEALGESELMKRGSGAARPRALQDERHGFEVEVALVLNKELEVKPGRPFRLGTRLSAHLFRMRSLPDTGGISPVPLGPETIEEFGLPKSTQVFVRFDEDLLDADSVADAMTVYANADLLEALRLRRSGAEFDFIARNLAIVALQQLVFRLATELDEEEIGEDQQSVMLDFLAAKLAEAHPPRYGKMGRKELLSKLKNEPEVLAAVLAGMKGYTQSARAVLKPDESETSN